MDDYTNNTVSLLRLLLWICVIPNDCFACRIYLVNSDLPPLDWPPLSEKVDFVVSVDRPPPVIKLHELCVAEVAALTVVLVLARGEHIIPFLVTRNVRVGELRQFEREQRSKNYARCPRQFGHAISPSLFV